MGNGILTHFLLIGYLRVNLWVNLYLLGIFG